MKFLPSHVINPELQLRFGAMLAVVKAMVAFLTEYLQSTGRVWYLPFQAPFSSTFSVKANERMPEASKHGNRRRNRDAQRDCTLTRGRFSRGTKCSTSGVETLS